MNYNSDFRVASQTVNGGDAVAFSYDRDGLLTGAGGLTLSRSPANGLLVADALGLVASSYRYTTRGELAGVGVTVTGTGLFATGYQRDSLGRISALDDTTQGTPTHWRFVYDSIGRLVADSVHGAPFHAFSYAANGNRLSYTSSNGTVSYSYDAQDRLLSAGTTTYTYGSNGELRTKTVPGVGTTTYTYDALGNLITVVPPSGTRIDYVIDGQNRRIGRKINGVLVHGWLYQNQLNPVAELDGDGNVVSRFVCGSRPNVPDYLVKSGTTYRIVADHLGSVRLVVNVETGMVVQQIDYDEWGNVTQNTNAGFQPFGFAGGILDDSTGLVRFGARDYDPLGGRWAGKDPVRFEAAETDLYTYAYNDPLNGIDPSGLQVVVLAPGATWDGVDSRLEQAVIDASMHLNIHLYVNATTNGRHDPNSVHPCGQAADISRWRPVGETQWHFFKNDPETATDFESIMAEELGPSLHEAYGPDWLYHLHGMTADDVTELYATYQDHVHISVLPER